MAKRKGVGEKCDFASKLIRMGFEQVGDCTFFGSYIKVFKTQSGSDNKRYWQIQDISAGYIYFKSNHVEEVLDYLQHIQFLLNGGNISISIKIREPETRR